MRHTATTEVQQLQHLVERRGVGRIRGADREQPLEVTGNQVGIQKRFAGPHAIPVAANGVDLPVVGDEPERVRQGPGREGVGGEPRVHDRDGTLGPLIAKIRVVERQLLRGEHALVDDGATGQRGEIQSAAVGLEVRCDPLRAFTQRVHEPVELQPRRRDAVVVEWSADEQLAHERHTAPRRLTDVGLVHLDGQVTPAQDSEVLLGGDVLHPGDRTSSGVRIGRKKTDSRGKSVLAVEVCRRQVELDHLTQKGVGNLHQDAGAVTAVGLSSGRAAVIEVLEGKKAVGDDRMGTPSVDVGDHRHTTGIDFVVRVVQTLGFGELREQQIRPPRLAPASRGNQPAILRTSLARGVNTSLRTSQWRKFRC